MNLYLAATCTPFGGGMMKMYLAGQSAGNDGSKAPLLERVNLLESFFYISEWQIPLIHKVKSFMLDSGAFSFMMQPKIKVNWNEYVEKYADFITTHNVDYFFELDIDSIIGYENTVKLRNKLESLTGRQCIPVWHKSRGRDNFTAMCKEYNYVSIGGIVSGEIVRSEYKFFNSFCNIAHDNGAKIHGLGFTNTNLADYRFDSVDSTAWLYGNRGGFLYLFDGKIIKKIQKPPGTRLKSKEVAIHNFWEWVKYGEYLEKIICLAGGRGRPFVLQG